MHNYGNVFCRKPFQHFERIRVSFSVVNQNRQPELVCEQNLGFEKLFLNFVIFFVLNPIIIKPDFAYSNDFRVFCKFDYLGLPIGGRVFDLFGLNSEPRKAFVVLFANFENLLEILRQNCRNYYLLDPASPYFSQFFVKIAEVRFVIQMRVCVDNFHFYFLLLLLQFNIFSFWGAKVRRKI